MRPGGDLLAGRSRKDLDVTTPTSESHASPTSFFLATEDSLGRISAAFADPGEGSNFGIRSLQETIYEKGVKGDEGDEEDADADNDDDGKEGDAENTKEKGARRRSTLKPKVPSRESSSENVDQAIQSESPRLSGARSDQRRPSYPSTSQSVNSLSQASQMQGLSMPSSPKSTSTRSLRHSDEESVDDGGCQAILSSEEDDIEPSTEVPNTAPQLIMPSIKMPSRRPFTDRGKDIGRLKILIAGDSGVGKTSLIKSIVQLCEEIVHVDPLSSNTSSLDQLPTRKSKGKPDHINANSTTQITEVYASTKAYPPWWSEIEESRVLRRRKSMGDTVLERNLCFVDTPGYSNRSSTSENIRSIVQYVESQLTKVFSLANASESELLSLLSGHGGAQVDVVFFMIQQRKVSGVYDIVKRVLIYHPDIKPTDLDFLRRLSKLTNIIPLIAKADLLSNDEVQSVKVSVTDELESACIRPFMFDPSGPTISAIYTVCSAPSNDKDNMDASLLMSSEYIQPLLPSDLNKLVQRLFDKDHIQCLRHLAAKKLINSRKDTEVTSMISSFPLSSLKPLEVRPLSHSTSIASPTAARSLIPYASGASSYIQIGVADHTQREEKLAQVRLAKWAGDLQRSLQNERVRYEALCRGERAVWLTERLGECVHDGTLAPIQSSANVMPSEKAFSSSNAVSSVISRRLLADGGDSLGLLRWNEAMRRRSWIAFQVVGSFGVLGAMAVWMARSWGLSTDDYLGWNWVWWDR